MKKNKKNKKNKFWIFKFKILLFKMKKLIKIINKIINSKDLVSIRLLIKIILSYKNKSNKLENNLKISI